MLRASSSVLEPMLDGWGPGPTAEEANWTMPFFDIFVKTLHITRTSERSKNPTSICPAWRVSAALEAAVVKI